MFQKLYINYKVVALINGVYWSKKFKSIKKNAKFIKITKAGFYESMVHSVEMTQNQLISNYDSTIINIYNYFYFFNK